jgi:hypothetical protein
MNSMRPRGRWRGAAAWHPQVVVVAPSESTDPTPGESIEVDEELAPILLALWRHGFPTGASCQNAPLIDGDAEESGEAHIHFLTLESADRFGMLIGDAIVYKPSRTGASVAFPTERLADIAALVESPRHRLDETRLP